MYTGEDPALNGRLRALRIIWAALIMGQVAFLTIVLVNGKNMIQSSPGRSGPDPHFIQLLFYIAAGMLVVLVSIGWVIRGVIYRSGRRENGLVTPEAYVTGNIIFFAMCEGVGLFAITGAMLNGGQGPHLYVTAVALAIQIVSFPMGKPMRGG